MRKTLKIRPKPILVPEKELELKLVQDTRINPDVIHLYMRGVDLPLMQFLIRDGKLVFHRITAPPARFGENIEIESTQFHSYSIAEAPEKVYLSWPTSAEAFDEVKEIQYASGGKMSFKPGERIEYDPDPSVGRPSAADLDVVASDPFYSDKFVAKPRC